MSAKPYYRVGPSIWHEPWGDDARYVAFYVLTCEHRTTEGYFRLPIEYVIADLEWTPRRFQAAFDQLVAGDFIDYDPEPRVCLIVKALEWQSPENPNQVKAAMKMIERVPPSALFERFIRSAVANCERLAKALEERFPEPFHKAFAEPIGEPPSPAPSPAPSHSSDLDNDDVKDEAAPSPKDESERNSLRVVGRAPESEAA